MKDNDRYLSSSEINAHAELRKEYVKLYSQLYTLGESSLQLAATFPDEHSFLEDDLMVSIPRSTEYSYDGIVFITIMSELGGLGHGEVEIDLEKNTQSDTDAKNRFTIRVGKHTDLDSAQSVHDQYYSDDEYASVEMLLPRQGLQTMYSFNEDKHLWEKLSSYPIIASDGGRIWSFKPSPFMAGDIELLGRALQYADERLRPHLTQLNNNAEI